MESFTSRFAPPEESTDPVTYVCGDDGLLLEGFSDAVNEGWQKSVGPAIERSLRAMPEEYMPEQHKECIQKGIADGASDDEKSAFTALVGTFGDAVLQRRQDVYNKVVASGPAGILVNSYAALHKDFGFSEKQTVHLAKNEGNQEYLSYYTLAAVRDMKATPFAKELGELAEKNDADIIRYERKREKVELSDAARDALNEQFDENHPARQFLEGNTFRLMDFENALLAKQGLHITTENTLGMNLDGENYTRDLELPETGQVVVFVGDKALEKKVTSGDPEQLSGKISKSLGQVAEEERLTIASVHASKDKGFFTRLVERFKSIGSTLVGLGSDNSEGRHSVPVVNVWDDNKSVELGEAIAQKPSLLCCVEQNGR